MHTLCAGRPPGGTDSYYNRVALYAGHVKDARLRSLKAHQFRRWLGRFGVLTARILHMRNVNAKAKVHEVCGEFSLFVL